MLDSRNRLQPDQNEYEHVLCSHVHSNAVRCWLDLLHTHAVHRHCESHGP